MEKEEIKKVLEEFVQEDGTIDLDGACEALESTIEEGSSSNQEKGKEQKLTLDDVAKMSKEEINKRWDEVQVVLKEAK